jgi:hypothetical protein
MLYNNFKELSHANPACCSKSKVASEKGKRFEVISDEDFTKIKIDNCLISSKSDQKCDYGFIRISNNDFYFVELKGKAVQKAYDQIISTLYLFETNFIKIPKNNRFGFIVSSSASVPRASQRNKNLISDFINKHGKMLIIKSDSLKYVP